ncbi:hypothetical protein SAMN05192586_101188 [Desulfovibrio legallii]|uniref:YgjP-like metallopeptidase domain-containing protein n=2 Tax=Desulfovibrio legallii TaxID=571438 RepID=A0A1G7I979_9BACT|nr:hypothetical protein SAMN05192586_101188 [Desulfovibrio legallii]
MTENFSRLTAPCGKSKNYAARRAPAPIQRKTTPPRLYSPCPLWQHAPMAAKSAALAPPLSVPFLLADGTLLTAAVRPSARARRTRLSLSPGGALTLTVPQGLPLQQLEMCLPSFLPWLERAWKARRARAAEPALPQAILLPLRNARFDVAHGGSFAAGRAAAVAPGARALLQTTPQGRVLAVETPGLLRLYGPAAPEACAAALQHWCRTLAATHLPPYVEDLALRGGFALARTSVRDQRGRWGSCSRRPTADGAPAARLNLNWRALLLPLPLLEHLCWHELCHLRHMNHSPAYRAELARYSPRWPEQEKALNRAWRALPRWALPMEG